MTPDQECPFHVRYARTGFPESQWWPCGSCRSWTSRRLASAPSDARPLAWIARQSTGLTRPVPSSAGSFPENVFCLFWIGVAPPVSRDPVSNCARRASRRASRQAPCRAVNNWQISVCSIDTLIVMATGPSRTWRASGEVSRYSSSRPGAGNAEVPVGRRGDLGRASRTRRECGSRARHRLT
jgi:hypothetical protein